MAHTTKEYIYVIDLLIWKKIQYNIHDTLCNDIAFLCVGSISCCDWLFFNNKIPYLVRRCNGHIIYWMWIVSCDVVVSNKPFLFKTD